jgi:16S rRNA pseudouridine516 synthase
MRIDKYISELGIASRKEASGVARKGGVIVNGSPVKDLSSHIDPERDKVIYLGRELSYAKFVYVMLNKPEGYVSATEDAKLPVVTELLPEELQKRELFPVGRLDKDTVGLMILTNNGKLAHTVLSPKRHVSKEYFFRAAEPLPAGAEKKFSEGVTLGDGYECKPAILKLDEGRESGIITLTEGKYHQIKRMFGAVGNKITALKRLSFGDILLDETLEEGAWRYLTDEEIKIFTGNK